jgi:hypothetical protein
MNNYITIYLARIMQYLGRPRRDKLAELLWRKLSHTDSNVIFNWRLEDQND